MATRYSKRRADGTVAYYDSEAAMHADVPPAPGLFDFSWLWALVGFFVSVITVCVATYGFDLGSAWPKGLRFAVMVMSVGAGTYLLARIGQLLFYSFWVLIGISLLISLLGVAIAAIWHFA